MPITNTNALVISTQETMKTATIKARVTPEIVDRLDKVVERSTGDRSDHIRQALAEYIARHETPTNEDDAPRQQ